MRCIRGDISSKDHVLLLITGSERFVVLDRVNNFFSKTASYSMRKL